MNAEQTSRLTPPDTDEATLDAVVGAAAEAFLGWSGTPRSKRAAALDAIADGLEVESASIVSLAARETALGEARVRSELIRTTFQLQMFADLLRDGSYLRPVVEPADANHPVAPSPDLRLISRPLGPVAVFAASNFPLAFSVAGTDTASALAAGCSVVVKAHPGHPQTSELVGRITSECLQQSGAPTGTFAVVHGFAAGPALVRHPMIRAASFTGSVRGGRALFDIAASRPDPIPFFGELGSLNSLTVLPGAATTRGGAIGADLADSVLLGGGQFCTKPGLLLLPSGGGGAEVTNQLVAKFCSAPPVMMLTSQVSDGYEAGRRELAATAGVTVLAEGAGAEERSVATLFEVTPGPVPDLAFEECFGPTAVVATYDSPDELLTIARRLPGALTGTVHAEPEDRPLVERLLDELAPRVGRVIFNQYPTGVSVSAAMEHGGPYPASTDVQHTSVGAAAIYRFLRPISFQNAPAYALPDELREPNPPTT